MSAFTPPLICTNLNWRPY